MLDDHDLNRLIAGVGWSWCVHTTFSSRVNPQGSLEMTGCREGDEASRSTSIRIGAGIDLDNRRVEAIGSKRTSEQAFEMLRPNDTAMVIGVFTGRSIARDRRREPAVREDTDGLEHGLDSFPGRHGALRRLLLGARPDFENLRNAVLSLGCLFPLLGYRRSWGWLLGITPILSNSAASCCESLQTSTTSAEDRSGHSTGNAANPTAIARAPARRVMARTGC